MKILMSSNPENLKVALAAFTSTATVEAEYGDVVVEGSVVTLAHHGKRSARPCPCLCDNLNVLGLGIEAIGISHMDLDTLGGVMAVMGSKPEPFYEGEYCSSRVFADFFWRIASYVDTHGAHKLAQWSDTHLTVDTLCNIQERGLNGGFDEEISRYTYRDLINAWWAWSEENRKYPPRDGSVEDVTEFVTSAREVVEKLLSSQDSARTDLVEEGRQWAEKNATMDADTFVSNVDGVILRTSEKFVNHLYRTDTRAIVSYNPLIQSLTVSVPDTIDGFSCGEFLKKEFGPLAGGHAGIGGTPRGEVYTLDRARELQATLAALLSA